MSGTIIRRGEGETLNCVGMSIRFLADAKDTRDGWSLMEEQVALGLGPPPHRHDWDEAYYVIAGALDFEAGGEPARLHAGDFAYVPRNTVHVFKGASQTPAHILIFCAPAHSSAFFKEMDREVRGVADLAKAPSIAARHGIEFVAPRK